MTTFTSGAEQTLPIWILTNLSRPDQLPVVNVVAVVRDPALDDPGYLATASRASALTRGRSASEDRRSSSRRHGDEIGSPRGETRRFVDERDRGVQHKNFVGGEWVEPSRADDGDRQPRDRRGDRRGPAGHAGGRRPRRRGGQEGASGVARDDARRAGRAAAQARRRDRREHRGAGAARVAERRQAAVDRRDEMPVCADNLRFFAGRGAHARGPLGGRVHARATRR